MKKNKKTIIIGMLIFLFVFLIYVVYYETNNIEVDYNIYYLNYKVKDKLEIEDYRILGIIENEDEYNSFLNSFDLYEDGYRDYKNNYIQVAVKSDSCGETVSFNKIKKNNDRYELIFKDKLSCYHACSDEVIIYEIPIDKELLDISKFDVVINYDDSELVDCDDYDRNDMVVKKPVLYLYPENDMMVKVTFDNKDKLLSTYPKYKDEWNVFAKKDGKLIDENGREYYALYWDENIKHKEKFETGFYVKSSDSIRFLEEKLFEMGFTDREANEFIMYWLPIMEQGGDNLVHFHFTEERQEQNKINIEPKVDSLFRVSIEIKKVNKKVSIKEQKIERFERYGFSALEWGGSIIK